MLFPVDGVSSHVDMMPYAELQVEDPFSTLQEGISSWRGVLFA